ncbi:MAG TPA: 3-phosphoserine/phosphohydroxythreonine transaminase [Edaphocola sp.]|nr:3-phosphoserine/phosphohydroxythreonine transaminase [Edaphocola sp.]
MMKLNFNAGAAPLPQAVISDAAQALFELEQTGISILGLGHRSAKFKSYLAESKQLVLQLLGLDAAEYEVIWFQGGGRMQFELIPMNFLGEKEMAAYIDSGHWAHEAMKSASRYGKVHLAASSREQSYSTIPEGIDIPAEAKYLHLTANNTIYGTQFHQFPQTSVPLIADFSSELFSRRVDYSRFGLIYAVAQKNIGPAGATLVVIRKDMLAMQARSLPDIMSFKAMAEQNSLVNTAPVFAIYVSLLNLRHMAGKGLDSIEEESKAKAQLLYELIDSSSLYQGMAAKDCRSRMNVCFRLSERHLEPTLLHFAEDNNIVGIEGHRSVGGFRISLYNGISIEAVEHLVAVLQKFEQLHKNT